MDELLLNFLGREREKTVRIGERTCAMRLLSARQKEISFSENILVT